MTEHESLERIVEGLKQAEGGARQMAHHRKDERWLKIAHQFENARRYAIAVSLRTIILNGDA